ncbi:MAG: penicillin acylase family protein [Bacteroidota bacterium]
MKYILSFFLLLPTILFAQIDPLKITIARDSFGVPHIFAATDPEVAYGLAWAHAEDDFKTLQLVMLSGKAKLGSALGKKGAQADYVINLLRCRETVMEQWSTLSPDFVALVKGYVQGLNDYAKTHPREVKYKKAFPFNEQDYVAATVFSLSIFCGVDHTLSRILGGQVSTLPGFSYEGSNAFAFHPSRTETGEAFLAINAHQPVEGPTAFYEAHLQSEQGWNMLGGLFPGGCLIFHGTNENLGWAHTVNNPDKIDVFQLRMNPGNKNQYWFDGKWIDLEIKKARLKIKRLPVTVSKKVYWSMYGATVKTTKGVFSVRLPASMDIRALEQWYRMNKAKNFSEFYKALSMVSIPMFNIMYADRYDTIFYISNAKLPVRNGDRRYHWRQTLPGDTSATLWTKFKPVEALPQYINPTSGFLYNTNHSPFNATLGSENLDPRKFDRNDGFEMNENNRSERFRELIRGLDKISYEEFKAIKFDQQFPRDLHFGYGIKNMINLDTAAYPKYTSLIKNFAAWDRTAPISSKGAAVFLLAYEFLQKKLQGIAPREITTQEAVETFDYIHEYMESNFRTTEPVLGDVQRLIRGTTFLPATGLPDMLAATYADRDKDGFFKVTSGDAYICLVRYPKKGLPIIESINTFGASADPKSPHYTDQLKRFQTKQLKPMTLDKNLILQNAERVYHPVVAASRTNITI